MEHSESIKELTAALAKAQAVIEGAVKDKANPAFRSKYADLGNCWDAVRKPLSENGLALLQFPRLVAEGIEVETLLSHVSGEYVTETLVIPLAKRDAHGIGSAITYGRRYGMCAIIGIAPEDDDGNKAKDDAANIAAPDVWTTELCDLAQDAAKRGSKAYREFWKSLSDETRKQLVDTEQHANYKKSAAAADDKATVLRDVLQ